MKKLLLTSISLALGISSAAVAAISGTSHDLSSVGSSSETCIYCHTPHSGSTSTFAPLWNRADPASTFTMYTSPTMDMTVAAAPQAQSLACLSCHDGSIAVDSFGGAAGSTFINAGAIVGPDLSTEHPVSVTYDPSQDTNFGLLATVQAALPLYGGANNQVECASCHDAHGTPFGSFLRIDNAGSALCLTCHDI